MTDKQKKVNFEDALDMTGFGRYNLCIFILCSSIIIGMSHEVYSVSYLVPASVCELNTTSYQQGLIASVPLLGIIATSHFWGYFADTKGRRRILIISMSLGFACSILSAFSPNWIVMCFLKVLSSASVAGAYAISLTLLSECIPRAKRSTVVILSTSVFLSSVGLLAVIAIPVLPLTFSYYIPYLDIHFNSWRLLCIIFALPSAISAFGVFFAYESPKYLLGMGREDEALEVLKGMYVINTGKSRDTFEVHALELGEVSSSTVHKGFFKSMMAQTIPMMRPPLLKYTCLLGVLYVIIYFCIHTYLTWMPYIVNAAMVSVTEGDSHLSICEMIRSFANSSSIVETRDCSMNTGAMTLIFIISMLLAVINLFITPLINCFGRKKVFIGLQMTGGLAALCINSSPSWILTGVLFMTFISGIINFGFLTTYSVDIFPTYVKLMIKMSDFRAMAVCLTLMVGRGSAVVGVNVLKKLFDVNCEASFYLFGSIYIAGALIAFLLPSNAKILAQKKLQSIN